MPKAKTQERKETSGKDLTKHQRYYRRHASNRKKQAREYYRSTKTVAAGRKQEPIESDEEESNESESSAGEQQHIHNQKPEARQEEPDSDSNDDDSPSKEYRSVSVQTRHQSPLVIQKFRGTAEDANAEFKAILLLPNGEDYPGYFLYLVLLNDKYYDWTHAHGGMAQWRKLRGDAGDDDASIYELHAQAGKELANEIRSTLEFGALWVEPREELTPILHQISFMLMTIGEGIGLLTYDGFRFGPWRIKASLNEQHNEGIGDLFGDLYEVGDSFGNLYKFGNSYSDNFGDFNRNSLGRLHFCHYNFILFGSLRLSLVVSMLQPISISPTGKVRLNRQLSDSACTPRN
ncbi:hypothetical protein F5878DRAFT_647284 [Lentinula raphanica]|uniref:Uncharacterized protein n=1 Tax=Lentinula raphanica TaxID=153919 RepID=A0AA38NWC8_9AGAR|nr:hypothetical protein F5878DRAFT_647284 [Lentinula raphanica]